MYLGYVRYSMRGNWVKNISELYVYYLCNLSYKSEIIPKQKMYLRRGHRNQHDKALTAQM